jgi:hypothetical protein
MYPTAILSYLTPFKNKRDILVHQQDVGDIITGILLTHDRYAKEYDKIVGFFIGRDGIETAKNVWAFVKRNVTYKVEPENEQLLKSPAAIITPATIGGKRNTSDCKNMSLFIGGILAAAERKGQKINWCYRFSSYKFLDKVPQHVFCVINPDTSKEIWVDAVLPTFNNHKQYYYKTDKKVKNMALVSLAGMGATKKKKAAPATKEEKKKKRQAFFKKLKETAKKTGKIIVKYNPATVVSRNAFITLTTINARSLATNLKNIISRGDTQVFTIWSKLGGNKDALVKAIETGAKKKRLGAIPAKPMTVNKGIVNPRSATTTAVVYVPPAVPVRYANNLTPETSNIYDDETAPELETEPETEIDTDSIDTIGALPVAAAAIAAAAPILALILPLFKKNGISDKDATDITKDVQEAGIVDAQSIADAIDKEANGTETAIGDKIIKGGTKAPATAGGKLPILPIAAGAAVLYFLIKKK